MAVVALMVSSFFAGYIFGGGGKTVSFNLGANPSQLAGVQPFQFPPTSAPVKVSSISINGSHLLGRPDAAVTLVEFADFQCPFCGSFFTNTLPQIEKTYVDTGKVNLVYKHFPLTDLHPDSKEAANAAECAGAQGKFWQYHDLLYGNQTQWAEQSADQVALTFKRYASGLGLNPTTFNSCLNSSKYSSIIDNDLEQGSKYGVSGTPTFYLGNDKNGYTQILGAKPFTIFQLYIDQLLSHQH